MAPKVVPSLFQIYGKAVGPLRSTKSLEPTPVSPGLAKGKPCQQGQTEARDGCIPTVKEPSKQKLSLPGRVGGRKINEEAKAVRVQKANTRLPEQLIPQYVYVGMSGEFADKKQNEGIKPNVKGVMGHEENRTDSVYVATNQDLSNFYANNYENPTVLKIDTNKLDKLSFYYDGLDPTGYDQPQRQIAYRGVIPSSAIIQRILLSKQKNYPSALDNSRAAVRTAEPTHQPNPPRGTHQVEATEGLLVRTKELKAQPGDSITPPQVAGGLSHQGEPCERGWTATATGCIPNKETTNEPESSTGGGTGDPGLGRTSFGSSVGDNAETKTVQGRILKVGPEGPPFDPRLVPEGIREQLNEYGIEGVSRAVAALDKFGGYVLADGTGVGKTRQQLAVAKIYADQGKKVLMVSPGAVLKPNWETGELSGSFANDSKVLGMNPKLTKGKEPLEHGQVYITTYDDLEAFQGQVDKDTIIIFDEAHNLKRLTGEEIVSAKAVQGFNLAKEAGGVLYATATVIDKPFHIAYLFRTKIFGDKPYEETFEELGMTQSGKRWNINPKVGKEEVYHRLTGLFNHLIEQGLMIKRELSMENVEVSYVDVPLSEEAKQSQVAIQERTKKGSPLLAQRRQLEPYKIPAAVAGAKKDLAEGKQVIIFASRVNATTLDDAEGGNAPLVSEGTLKQLKAALALEGIEDVAEIHGGVHTDPEKRQAIMRQAMEDFQSGKKRVVIATIESGGTGINLDDTVGDKPRSMYIMTAPFSGMELSQAIGRINRLNTKSKSKVQFLFSDAEVDTWNRKLVSGKMKTLQTTGGQVVDIDEEGDETSSPEKKPKKERKPYSWPNIPEGRETPAPNFTAPPKEKPKPAPKEVKPAGPVPIEAKPMGGGKWYAHDEPADRHLIAKITKLEKSGRKPVFLNVKQGEKGPVLNIAGLTPEKVKENVLEIRKLLNSKSLNGNLFGIESPIMDHTLPAQESPLQKRGTDLPPRYRMIEPDGVKAMAGRGGVCRGVWRTIGAKQSAKKESSSDSSNSSEQSSAPKKHGGVRVCIERGRITKGPKNLKSKKINEISKSSNRTPTPPKLQASKLPSREQQNPKVSEKPFAAPISGPATNWEEMDRASQAELAQKPVEQEKPMTIRGHIQAIEDVVDAGGDDNAAYQRWLAIPLNEGRHEAYRNMDGPAKDAILRGAEAAEKKRQGEVGTFIEKRVQELESVLHQGSNMDLAVYNRFKEIHSAEQEKVFENLDPSVQDAVLRGEEIATKRKKEDDAVQREVEIGKYPSPNPTPAKKAMQNSPIVESENLGGGCNVTVKATLEDGTEGVYKPEKGENARLRKAVKGRYYAREAASYDVAEVIGLHDLVPVTVVRDGKDGVGSFQKFAENAVTAVEGKINQQYDKNTIYDGDEDLARATAFDYLIGNSDRHSGNWMLNKKNKLILIDNGLSFPDTNAQGGNFYFMGEAVKRKLTIPASVKSWDWNKVQHVLKGYGFNESEIKQTQKRFDHLQATADFTKLKKTTDFEAAKNAY